MSAAYISTQYPSQQYIQFSIDAAMHPKNSDIFAIYNSFLPFCELTYGKVYKRGDSTEFWYVNPGSTVANLISEERVNLFLSWDKKRLLPDEAIVNKLSEIGGLPYDGNTFSSRLIQFPCKVNTVNGQSIDLCLLHFSDLPPYQYHFKNILLLDDIIDIEPSELSLPHSLRLESMLAGEMRMGFYPFLLKTKAGNLVLYDGTTEFASNGEIKGSDVECQVPFSYDSAYKVVNVSIDEITVVVGKWDSRIEELFMRCKMLLEEKERAKKRFSQNTPLERKPNENFFNRVWKWIKGT